MFCKICFDCCRAGYDNHNLRDFKGNTICPYLLNITCLNCGVNGHTVKYCKKSVGFVKKSVGFDFKPTRVNGGIKVAPVLNTTMFSTLCYDVDEVVNNSLGLVDEFTMNDIVWGIGLKSMNNMSWADECGF